MCLVGTWRGIPERLTISDVLMRMLNNSETIQEKNGSQYKIAKRGVSLSKVPKIIKDSDNLKKYLYTRDRAEKKPTTTILGDHDLWALRHHCIENKQDSVHRCIENKQDSVVTLLHGFKNTSRKKNNYLHTSSLHSKMHTETSLCKEETVHKPDPEMPPS